MRVPSITSAASGEEQTRIQLSANGVEADGPGASVSGSTVAISQAGAYFVNGILVGGQIRVEAGDDDTVILILNGMQGYQPVASYAYGAKNEERFHASVRFALKRTLLLTALVAVLYIVLAKPLILLFNRNPAVVEYGRWLLISQVALYPAFGLCHMMTITFQTVGASRMGLFLSLIRQGLFYIPFILTLPGTMGVMGIYLSQPAADVLTTLVCVLLIKPMKRIAVQNRNE